MFGVVNRSVSIKLWGLKFVYNLLTFPYLSYDSIVYYLCPASMVKIPSQIIIEYTFNYCFLYFYSNFTNSPSYLLLNHKLTYTPSPFLFYFFCYKFKTEFVQNLPLITFHSSNNIDEDVHFLKSKSQNRHR